MLGLLPAGTGAGVGSGVGGWGKGDVAGVAPAPGGQVPDGVASTAAELGREAGREQEEAVDVDTDEPGAAAEGRAEDGPRDWTGHVSRLSLPGPPGAAGTLPSPLGAGDTPGRMDGRTSHVALPCLPVESQAQATPPRGSEGSRAGGRGPGSGAPGDRPALLTAAPWGPPQRPALDCGHLLRSCLQGAVGLLQDPDGGGRRNVRRLEILLGLLGEDAGDGEPPTTHHPPHGPARRSGGSGRPGGRGRGCPACGQRRPLPPAVSFARVARARLHELLRRQEEGLVLGRKDWVAQVAASPDALHEAGTFRYTPTPRAARTGVRFPGLLFQMASPQQE